MNKKKLTFFYAFIFGDELHFSSVKTFCSPNIEYNLPQQKKRKKEVRNCDENEN